MKREVYTITKDYQFDITHKGAPYCIDGTWKNAGEAVEILEGLESLIHWMVVGKKLNIK